MKSLFFQCTFALLSMLIISQVHGQSFSEKLHLGIGFGPMRYYGDIYSEYTQFSVAGNIRYELNDHFYIKGQVTFGSVGASDQGSERQQLHPFRSNIQEISIMPEFDLLNMNEGSKWTPYIFAGVGYFHYTPFYYEYNDVTKRYDKYNYDLASVPRKINIPFGGGIKYAITDNIRLFGEGNFRLTNTDEIDGYQFKSSSIKNDVYYNFLFGVTFRLGGDYSSHRSQKSSGHSRRNLQNCPPVYL
ncbi:DUF6089 family protein [Rhizosphaericola mali]|uniref:Porin family protein n=1 Tax=Rhizosphaericola mali TaxID=2545455 RepID=A0A5P2G1I8_9BACT|nr:DUF6089 family protein [Rhizosphaericola mali]QES87959.1 porin family protein [Rhizosphaericola mali]